MSGDVSSCQRHFGVSRPSARKEHSETGAAQSEEDSGIELPQFPVTKEQHGEGRAAGAAAVVPGASPDVKRAALSLRFEPASL